jgi:hypothetical protein
MAWVTEYDLKWTSDDASVWGYIYLQRDGGSYQMPLTLKKESLEIRNIFPSMEDPIARMNCTFTIVNDLSDFFTLIPLITTALGQVRVVVTDERDSNPDYLFIGFLNCETVNQKLLKWSDITLTASGYISKLQNEYPDSVNSLQYTSLVDTIIDCLVLTGSEDPLHINISLYENNSAPASNQTLFNRIDAFQEVWWKNNHERMSALEILTSIMKSFNCYLYWANNKWVIRHYEDFGDLLPHFVVYDVNSSASYGYTDTGTTYDPSYGAFYIHDLTSIEGTQEMSVVPGLREYDIRLDLKKYWNLFYPDLADMYESTDPTPALNSRRQWWAYDNVTDMTWDQNTFGKPFRDIENSAYRYGDDLDASSGYGEVSGLSTRFNLTAQYDTVLNIKFKFGIPNLTYLYASGLREDITITFHYYLCTYDSVEANRDYFDHSDDSTDTWTFVADGDPRVNYNTVVITAADLDDDLWTYEASINVPIGEISGVLDSSGEIEDLDLIFCLGTEVCSQAGESDKAANSCYYGDIVATVSEEPKDNLIEGVITTDFVEKKQITLDLFDAGWSYRNSLFRYVNQYYNTLATDWTYGDSAIHELEDWLMKSKFRYYRIARQKLVMELHNPIILNWELLYPFIENKQNNMPLILMGQTIRPEGRSILFELYEYDNTETMYLT